MLITKSNPHFKSVFISAMAAAGLIGSMAMAQDATSTADLPSSRYQPVLIQPPIEQKPFIVPAAPNGAPAAEAAWDGDKPFVAEAHAPQFPARLFPREFLEGLRPAAKDAFNLADVSVQEMPTLRVQDGGETLIALRFEGMAAGARQADYIVRLHHHSTRAPDAVLMVQVEGGALVEQPWPEVTTYRGTVDGLPGIEVAGSIIDGKVSLMLLPDDPARDTWFVQPLSDGLPGMPDGLHAIYRSVDVFPSDAQCGWAAMGGAPPLIPAGNQANAGPPARPNLALRLAEQLPANLPTPLADKNDDDNDGHDDDGDSSSMVANVRAQIGYDADVEFYQANGSSVVNTIYDMMMIMNQVGLIYQNQVGISYTDVIIIIRTVEPDPYTATNANTLICQFGEWWNGNVGTNRDVAHLFTGKDLDGTTVGLAWIGNVCFSNFSNCNPNGSSLCYGLVQSRFTTNLTQRVQDSAHELGHNWNACHCNTGGNCGAGTSNPVCGIMSSNISGQTNFDAAAITAITSFRDVLSPWCLDAWFNPTYVNWSYGGAETGSISQPWNTIFEGLDACLAGGTLTVQGGNYFQNPNIFKAKNIIAVNGTVRIGN